MILQDAVENIVVKKRIDSLNDCNAGCLSPFSTVFQLYRGGQCTYPCLPGVLLTRTLHYILSKSLAAFQVNYCPKNGQQ